MEIQLSIIAITPTKCLVISGSTLEAIPIQLQTSTLWVQTTLFVCKYKLFGLGLLPHLCQDVEEDQVSTVKHVSHPWTERVQERCPCSKTNTFTFARNLQLPTRINQSFMVRWDKYWALWPNRSQWQEVQYVWRSKGEVIVQSGRNNEGGEPPNFTISRKINN